MTKRKGGGAPGETRNSKVRRIHEAAMAIVETDSLRMRANTERLRALRLQKEAAEGTKRRPKV
jgi:hypothetical protein